MELIVGQIKYGLAGLFIGVLIRFCYDFILVFRRQKKIALARRLIEDSLFWVLASFFIFQTMLEFNHGILRGYFLILFLIGMWLYKKVAKNYFVDAVKRLIHLIFRPYVWFLKKIKGKQHKSKKSP